MTEVVERFWSKVNKEGPVHPTLGTKCWEWTASLTRGGYGQFFPKKFVNRQAHRFSYELVHGPIGDVKKLVMHRCDNKKCVNPGHLILGNHRENAWDAINKGFYIGKVPTYKPNHQAAIQKMAYTSLSQRRVAEIMNTTQTYVSRMKRKPSFNTLGV